MYYINNHEWHIVKMLNEPVHQELDSIIIRALIIKCLTQKTRRRLAYVHRGQRSQYNCQIYLYSYTSIQL